MSTQNRPELSKKNLYFIPKHRFYELKHFCLQYPLWAKILAEIDGYSSCYFYEKIPGGENWKSNVENVAELREQLLDKLDMIDTCLHQADPELYKWLRYGIIEGASYTALSTTHNIPCSKDMYYDRYRRFFWLLDKVRG